MPPKPTPPVTPRRDTGTTLTKSAPSGVTAENDAGADEALTPSDPAPVAPPSSAPEGPQTAPPRPPTGPPATPAPIAPSKSDGPPSKAAPVAPSTPSASGPPTAPAPIAPSSSSGPPSKAAPIAPSSSSGPPSKAAPIAPSSSNGPPSNAAPIAPSNAAGPPVTPAPVIPAPATPKSSGPSEVASKEDESTAATAKSKNSMFESSDEEEDDDDGYDQESAPAGYVDPEDEMPEPAAAPPALPPPAPVSAQASQPGEKRPSMLEYFRAANPDAMDSSVREILLCEGMLTKLKAAKAKSKARHFRLTENTFSYYEANAGALIARVKKTDIIHVEDVINTKQFRIKTSVEFGRDEGSTEMLLMAKDSIAKEKWLAAFSLDLNRPPKDYERLIVEGYLVKVQPMCTVSTTRWFVATNRTFGYYKSEGGPLYYKVLWEHIQFVTQTSNKKEFKLQASVPMTKTGFYDCTCRAKTKEERDKWVAMLQRILPQQKMSTDLQMACFMEE